MSDTKTCPYCGSEIPINVQKCKYCGEWLVLQEKDKPKASLHLGAWIEAIICIITVVCMFAFQYNDGIILIIFAIYVFLHLYFLPSLIADSKRTQYTAAIFVLNLLLGVTVIFWIGALVWALSLPNLNKNSQNLEDISDKKSFEETKSANLEINIPEKAHDLPDEVRQKFNWGAFWLTWIWGIGNKSWLTFWAFIPYFNIIWMFVCGFKGNEWAWENKNWTSIEEFNQVQKKWATVSNILVLSLFLISLILFAVAYNMKGNEETIIKNAITEYRKEKNKEEADKYGVSVACYKKFRPIYMQKGDDVTFDEIPCSQEENLSIINQLSKELEENKGGYALDDVELHYGNAGMPKSLVLQGVPIMCFEKANVGDNSKCTQKQLDTINKFFKKNDIDWNKEFIILRSFFILLITQKYDVNFHESFLY